MRFGNNVLHSYRTNTYQIFTLRIVNKNDYLVPVALSAPSVDPNRNDQTPI